MQPLSVLAWILDVMIVQLDAAKKHAVVLVMVCLSADVFRLQLGIDPLHAG